MSKINDVKYGIQTPPVPFRGFERAVPADQDLEALQRSMLVSRTLLHILDIKGSMRHFTGLDNCARVLTEKGRNLPESALQDIAGRVNRIRGMLPVGTVTARRSLELQSETRASGDRKVKFKVMDSDVVDRHGTLVRSDGIDLTNYRRNPIFVWAHNAYGGWTTPAMEDVIGKTIGFRQDSKVLELEVEFFKSDVNPKSEQALRMIRAGALSATSIGFIPLEVKTELREGKQVPVITRAELLEVSLVSIPSNPAVGVLAGRSR